MKAYKSCEVCNRGKEVGNEAAHVCYSVFDPLQCMPSREGKACDAAYCQYCCEHNEHDHFVCLDCGKELDAGSFIDAAEYAVGVER